MEHRWGRRVRVDVQVRILADPASAGWGRLRDISVSGGFIETGLRIPVLSTLSLSVPATCRRNTCTVHAIVVRNDLDGAGVEWSDDDGDVIAALMQDALSWPAPATFADPLRL